MNGKIRLRAGRRAGTIIGGPFDAAKKRWGIKKVWTVCLRDEPEYLLKADRQFPIVDFGVPKMEDVQVLVDEIVTRLLKDRPVYVGCTAGIGRTGTILACVWKAYHRCTGPEAVAGVRRTYLSHAVERPAQHNLIAEFVPLRRTRFKLWLARIGF